MVRRTVPEDVAGIISAEDTGNFHVVFSGISVLGIFVLFLLLAAAGRMGQAGGICRNIIVVADCSFRANVSGKICVNFVVCPAGDCGGNKSVINYKING